MLDGRGRVFRGGSEYGGRTSAKRRLFGLSGLFGLFGSSRLSSLSRFSGLFGAHKTN